MYKTQRLTVYIRTTKFGLKNNHHNHHIPFCQGCYVQHISAFQSSSSANLGIHQETSLSCLSFFLFITGCSLFFSFLQQIFSVDVCEPFPFYLLGNTSLRLSQFQNLMPLVGCHFPFFLDLD